MSPGRHLHVLSPMKLILIGTPSQRESHDFQEVPHEGSQNEIAPGDHPDYFGFRIGIIKALKMSGFIKQGSAFGFGVLFWGRLAS